MSLEQDVNWNEIESLIKTLSKKILKLPVSFSSITTVSRGGLIPSRLLADHLGIKTIFVDKKKIFSESLFVDDIFDTGDTFKKIISKTDIPSKLTFATYLHDVEKNTLKTFFMLKKLMMMDMLFSLGIN